MQAPLTKAKFRQKSNAGDCKKNRIAVSSPPHVMTDHEVALRIFSRDFLCRAASDLQGGSPTSRIRRACDVSGSRRPIGTALAGHPSQPSHGARRSRAAVIRASTLLACHRVTMRKECLPPRPPTRIKAPVASTNVEGSGTLDTSIICPAPLFQRLAISLLETFLVSV
jgi:hypothetical protein